MDANNTPQPQTPSTLRFITDLLCDRGDWKFPSRVEAVYPWGRPVSRQNEWTRWESAKRLSADVCPGQRGERLQPSQHHTVQSWSTPSPVLGAVVSWKEYLDRLHEGGSHIKRVFRTGSEAT